MLQDLWSAAFFSLCGLWLLEGWQPGFVSRFFNIHWMTALVAAASLALLAFRPAEPGPLRNAAVQVPALLAAAVTWIFLPDDLRLFWRTVASAAVLTAVLAGLPILLKAGHTAAD